MRRNSIRKRKEFWGENPVFTVEKGLIEKYYESQVCVKTKYQRNKTFIFVYFFY